MFDSVFKTVKPVLTALWGTHIYVFGLGVAVAFLVTLFLFWREVRRTSLNEEKQFDVLFASSIFGILIGRLVYVFLHQAAFKPTILKTILLFSFPGVEEIGFWVGFLFIWLLYALRNKLKFYDLFRVMAVPLLVGYTIVTFAAVLKEGNWYHALSALVLLGFFFVLSRQTTLIKQDKLVVGALFYTFVIAVSLSRFIVDFFITDKIYLWGTPLTFVQAGYSLALLVSFIWWGTFFYNKHQKAVRKHKQSDY